MDDDTSAGSDGSPRPRPQPTRKPPSRRAKTKTATRIPVRETRSTAKYFYSPSSEQTTPPDTGRRAPAPLRRSMRMRNKRKVKSGGPVAKTPKRPRVKSPTRESRLGDRCKTPVSNLLENSPVSPPWQTLPYHVWKSVFDFVAAPIRDTASRVDETVAAVQTLLAGAHVCRAIAEPALAGLYKCPPFHRMYFNKSSQVSFMQFLCTLSLPPSETIINYRPKVQVVRIDVDTFLSRKVGGVELTLTKVLSHLPRISTLELFHSSDGPPYRDLTQRLRWKLPEEDLLQALGPNPNGGPVPGGRTEPVRLRSWRWNSRLLPETLTLSRLSKIHALPNFQTLRKVAYVNYQLPSHTEFPPRARESEEAKSRDRAAISQFAASISALPDLEHLIIESSTLANGSLLEHLPKSLQHLELVNCWEITSDDLATFLMTSGHLLTSLTLKHCQSLSLGFLPVLGTSCPRLAHLEVDLNYFRHHAAYADNKPEYATLLTEDQVPTWPTSIQSIEMINMRNWTLEAAEMFFDSLMKNAKALPNLRRLEFKVILNIEWRQRQKLRQSLADRMTRVFKRKCAPPKKQGSLHRAIETVQVSPDITDLHMAGTSRTLRARNHAPSPKPRRFRKSLESLRSASTKFDADDEESSEDELSMCYTPPRRGQSRTTTARNAGLHEESIQGLCDVVDIQIDNQRPSEQQFNMDDFLDSAEGSETEWNGDDDEIFD
ncbi:hypothetical protein F5Y17DRAFT_431910 [Xylariaceae sp. FL0594]|nr:hypothetical protein F5Y17DRAFT_431910 [Xylariaceae sp. FL0594]